MPFYITACSGVKEVVSVGSVCVTAGQDNINVSLQYLSTHTPIRFDKFSEIMATLHHYHYDYAQSRPLDVALALTGL